MLTVVAFLVAIGVLVTVHEFGHYLVARWCGVKVLRFSIGFGKPIARFVRGGTEWVVALVPLGGYVKMLDEREGPVDAAERSQAFNTQSVFKRIAIVVAGPLANFLTAIVLFYAVLLPGGETLAPRVGMVVPQSAASAAGLSPGDTVRAVNGEPVADWDALRSAMAEGVGSAGQLVVEVERGQRVLNLPVDLQRFGLTRLDEKTVGRIGVLPQRFLPKIAFVEPGGAAEQAGLAKGDVLKTLDGRPVAGWGEWVVAIQNRPGQLMQVGVERAGRTLQLALRPASVEAGGVVQGRIGAAPALDEAWLASLRRPVDYGVFGSLVQAVERTWRMSAQTLKMMGGMFVGQVSLDAISGPLTIADYAGKTASMGWQSYLSFMAVISVSLGVLNLLPVPVLDGGHLLYYVAELVRGRPLSERAQQIGQRLGLALILTLMMIALFNDLGRMLGG